MEMGGEMEMGGRRQPQEMEVKEKASWTRRAEAGEASGQPPQDAAAASQNWRRMHREVTLALRSGLRDAMAEFSFLRIRGLRNLLKTLQSIAGDDAAIGIFRQSQSVPKLQVVPVLFQNTLRQPKDECILDSDHIFGAATLKINGPATDSEIAFALRVLEGCCLLHTESTYLAYRHNAIKVLTNILLMRGTLEQHACLDAFMALMLDSFVNQVEFEACLGIGKIAEIMKDKRRDDAIRLKCGEFLLLLLGHMSGRGEPPLATVHSDLRRLLGEQCTSLIWAACQFGSTLYPKEGQMALSVQAQRILDALEHHS